MFLFLRDEPRRRGYTRTGNWFGSFEGKYSLRRSIQHSSASHVLQLRAARNLISVILPSQTSPVPTSRQNQITIFLFFSISACLILGFFNFQCRSALNIISICFVFGYIMSSTIYPLQIKTLFFFVTGSLLRIWENPEVVKARQINKVWKQDGEGNGALWKHLTLSNPL